VKIIEAIAKRTRELLISKNKTQYGIEKTMGMPHKTLNNIMTAKNNAANIKTIFQICKGLDVTVDEFFNSPIFKSDELDID
jgi:transcriptional regulator with XRE-family HTH domain